MPMMGGGMGMMPMNQMGMGGMGYQGRPPMGRGMGGGMVMGPGMGMGMQGGQYMGPGGPGGPRMMGSGMGMGSGGPRMMGGPGGGMGGPGMGGMGGGAGMGMGSPGMMLGSPGAPLLGSTVADGAAEVKGEAEAPAPQPAQQSKDVNTSTVCRIGQETVEEIVSRTQEVFSILKSLQPPVGAFNQQTQQHDKSNQEKQNRLQDVLKGIGMLFKRLRVCWEKCQENTGGMDFTPIESLLPLKEDGEAGRVDVEKKRGEAHRAAAEEHQELVQQITLKNRHLKDVIDQMRNIIWEINTMLAIRKA